MGRLTAMELERESFVSSDLAQWQCKFQSTTYLYLCANDRFTKGLNSLTSKKISTLSAEDELSSASAKEVGHLK